MIAQEAGKFISPFIDKTWPSDRSEIYDILELGINKAWIEGKWLGMTKEGWSQIFKDSCKQSYFLAPQSHPILLGININGVPKTIRDNYFMFHKNGNGDLNKYDGCDWNTDVYDLGEVAYHNKLNINFAEGVLVGVRSIGPAGKGEYVTIDGTHIGGNGVYTYNSKTYGNPCGCSTENQSDTIQGIRLDINEKFNYASNIKFEDIRAINKSVTRSPIEIIVIDKYGDGMTISRMEPYQTESKYRKYLVPNNCVTTGSVHAIFKISKQEKITNDSTVLIINNKEALMCLCIGIHSIYYKKQLEYGSQMILQGITILEKEKRETESPSEFPVQIDNSLNSLPYTLQNLH